MVQMRATAPRRGSGSGGSGSSDDDDDDDDDEGPTSPVLLRSLPPRQREQAPAAQRRLSFSSEPLSLPLPPPPPPPPRPPRPPTRRVDPALQAHPFIQQMSHESNDVEWPQFLRVFYRQLRLQLMRVKMIVFDMRSKIIHVQGDPMSLPRAEAADIAMALHMTCKTLASQSPLTIGTRHATPSSSHKAPLLTPQPTPPASSPVPPRAPPLSGSMRVGGEHEQRARATALSHVQHHQAKGSADMFSREAVARWSSAQLNAWRLRHVNANAFFYRFTEPGFLQRTGTFTAEEHDVWMERYNQFKANKWHVGSSWGLFSLALPHKVGYQCSNYYRKMLREGVLSDPSYVFDDNGELKQIGGLNTDPDETCIDERKEMLEDVWSSPVVMKIEAQVNEYLSQLHSAFDTGPSYSPSRRTAPRTRTHAPKRKLDTPPPGDVPKRFSNRTEGHSSSDTDVDEPPALKRRSKTRRVLATISSSSSSDEDKAPQNTSGRETSPPLPRPTSSAIFAFETTRPSTTPPLAHKPMELPSGKRPRRRRPRPIIVLPAETAIDSDFEDDRDLSISNHQLPNHDAYYDSNGSNSEQDDTQLHLMYPMSATRQRNPASTLITDTFRKKVARLDEVIARIVHKKNSMATSRSARSIQTENVPLNDAVTTSSLVEASHPVFGTAMGLPSSMVDVSSSQPSLLSSDPVTPIRPFASSKPAKAVLAWRPMARPQSQHMDQPLTSTRPVFARRGLAAEDPISPHHSAFPLPAPAQKVSTKPRTRKSQPRHQTLITSFLELQDVCPLDLDTSVLSVPDRDATGPGGPCSLSLSSSIAASILHPLQPTPARPLTKALALQLDMTKQRVNPAAATTSTTWKGVLRSGRVALLLEHPTEEPQPGEAIPWVASLKASLEESLDNLVTADCALISEADLVSQLDRISRYCECQIMALDDADDLLFRETLFAGILRRINHTSSEGVRSLENLRSLKTWHWILIRWSIIDWLFRLSCIHNPLLDIDTQSQASHVECSLATQIERLLLEVLEILWTYSKARTSLHGLYFQSAVRLGIEPITATLDLLMALAQLTDSYSGRKRTRRPNQSSAREGMGNGDMVEEDIISFWHVFNKSCTRWLRIGPATLSATSDEPDLTRHEFLWELLFEATNLYSFNMAVGQLDPVQPSSAPPNWLLVETLLKNTQSVLVEALPSAPPQTLQATLPRAVYSRLCQLSLAWSSTPWPMLLTQLMSLWKARQFNDYPGDHSVFPPLLDLCPAGQHWPVRFHMSAPLATDTSCFHMFLWLLSFHLVASSPELGTYPVVAGKSLKQYLASLNRSIPGRIKIGESDKTSVASVRNVTCLIVLTSALTGSFGSAPRQIANLVDSAAPANLSQQQAIEWAPEAEAGCRGVQIEGHFYIATLMQRHGLESNVSEPFELIREPLAFIIKGFHENESKRYLPVVPTVFQQSPGDWTANKRVQWKRAQDARAQCLLIATKWVRTIVITDATMRANEALFTCGWLALLGTDVLLPPDIRVAALHVVQAFLNGGDFIRTTTVDTASRDASSSLPDSQEEQLFTDDLDFAALDAAMLGEADQRSQTMIKIRQTIAKHAQTHQLFQSCLQLINMRLQASQQRLQMKTNSGPVSATPTFVTDRNHSVALATYTGPGTNAGLANPTLQSHLQRYCLDDEGLDLAVDVLAQVAILIVHERPGQGPTTSWNYYLERLGPISQYGLSSRSSDDRRVGLRFFATIAWMDPRFVKEHELICWRLWFLSHLDYVLSAQPLLSIALSRAGAPWLPSPGCISESLVVYRDCRKQFLQSMNEFTRRMMPCIEKALASHDTLSCLAFVDYLGLLLQGTDNTSVGLTKDVRSRLNYVVSGLNVMLHLCLQEVELLGGDLFRQYTMFAAEIASRLVDTCTDILHSRDEPTSQLQLLLERLLLAPTIHPMLQSALDAHLAAFFRGLSKMDVARDAYLQRALRSMLEKFYIPSTPIQIDDTQRLQLLVDALVPRTNADILAVHRFRTYMLRTYMRRYLGAFGKSRPDLVYFSVFAVKTITSLFQHMYAMVPPTYKGARLEAWAQHFGDDLRLIAQPLLELMQQCTMHTVHVPLKSHFFRCMQVLTQADALVTRVTMTRSYSTVDLAGVSVIMRTLETYALAAGLDMASRIIIGQLDSSALPPTAVLSIASLQQLLKSLPSIEQARINLHHIVGDDPDYVQFEAQMPLPPTTVANNTTVPVSAPSTHLDTHKIFLVASIFSLWRTILLSRAGLSSQAQRQQTVWAIVNHFTGILSGSVAMANQYQRVFHQEILRLLPPEDTKALLDISLSAPTTPQNDDPVVWLVRPVHSLLI